jgi:hypothetical protein
MQARIGRARNMARMSPSQPRDVNGRNGADRCGATQTINGGSQVTLQTRNSAFLI